MINFGEFKPIDVENLKIIEPEELPFTDEFVRWRMKGNPNITALLMQHDSDIWFLKSNVVDIWRYHDFSVSASYPVFNVGRFLREWEKVDETK